MNTSQHRLRLSELNTQVSSAIQDRFQLPCWVVAEVAELKTNGVGHTYFSLVEKKGSEILAEARGTLWKFRSSQLASFRTLVGKPLAAGMEVLLLVQPTFHPRYGFSLDIREIDARFTLGDLARRRAEVIERLSEEQLLHLNKRLELPLVPQRIAVISSATAAGLQDFLHILENCPAGYSFAPVLFPAFMQGDGAEDSLLAAMASLLAEVERFDVLVMIRGGGGIVDLSCFDGYPLARAIAEYPLPVVTGIGHEKDESVADMVAFHNAATPTAAAEFLIARVRGFENELNSLSLQLEQYGRSDLRGQVVEVDRWMLRFMVAGQRAISQHDEALSRLAQTTAAAVRGGTERRARTLTELATKLAVLPAIAVRQAGAAVERREADLLRAVQATLQQRAREISQLERDVQTRDPADVLRRGFSITRINGRAVRDASRVTAGMRLETMVQSGTITSVVEEAGEHD